MTTPAQAEAITAQAQQMGVTVSEYCHLALSDRKIVAPFTEEELNLKRGLVGMANNLNQIAFRANAAGISSVERSALDLMQEVKKLLNRYK